VVACSAEPFSIQSYWNVQPAYNSPSVLIRVRRRYLQMCTTCTMGVRGEQCLAGLCVLVGTDH
jgi:hypothetical protein